MLREVIELVARLVRRSETALVLGAILALGLFVLPVAVEAQQQSQSPFPNISADQLLQQLNKGIENTTGSIANSTEPQILSPDQRQIGQRLPPSRIEQILSSRAGIRLEQFGYDQLGVGRSITVPQVGAVQDDYVLGPGDEIIVSLRGQENTEYQAVVDRNGQVTLPRLNPISAAGRTLGDVKRDLSDAVHRSYVATEAFLSLARVRQVSVLVTGEVNNPGERLVTGLSSPVDALLLAGGVKKSGSLRNVRVIHGGKEYVLDLYGMIDQQGSVPRIRMSDGDRVVVPALGSAVAVAGWVRRPAIYELPPGSSAVTVRGLIALAGGLELRGRYRFSVLRIMADGRSAMVALPSESGAVRDSEVLFAQPGANQTVQQATLSGGTSLAGRFPLANGASLAALLRAPGALGESPYTLFGLVSRKDARTYLRSLVPFSPIAVLDGTEDLRLQSDDVVRVFSLSEARLLAKTIRNFTDCLQAADDMIRNPLNAERPSEAAQTNQNAATTAPPANGQPQPANKPPPPQACHGIGSPSTSADQASSAAAAYQAAREAAQESLGESDIAQLSNESLGTDIGPSYGQIYPQGAYGTGQFAAAGQLSAFAQNGQANPLAQGLNGTTATDASQFQPGYTPNLQQRGPIAPNFEQEAVRPGGYPTNLEVHTFGDLARQLGVDPLVLINFLTDHETTIDGAVRGPGLYLVGPNVGLHDLIAAAGGTAKWADESNIELTSTVVDTLAGKSSTSRKVIDLHDATAAGYIVKPQDELRVGQVFTDVGTGSVTVQGEVRNAGIYRITRGEHLSEILVRAGGLTDVAYPYGAIFLRKSAAELERQGYQRVASEIEDQLLVGMTRVGNRIDAGAFGSLQAFVTQLRNQKPLGRISIVADPAVLITKPELDPLLEGGDVIYIPQRPTTVAVLGDVMQPGSYQFQANLSAKDYIKKAGGFGQFADDEMTFVILPDGTARQLDDSWLTFTSHSLPPGSAVVIPRDLSPTDFRQIILDATGIFSQLAVAAASLAVITRN